MQPPRTLPPPALAWAVWSLGAALYFIGFYQRVAPAVMTRELMADFALGAAALGNLSAFYFYSYVAMQIPTGILADRWGPRRLLTAGALIAAFGTLGFALAPTVAWANAGRMLIGASVAVAFVGMLKLASHWFAPRQFALAGGMALLVGVVGAVTAGVPLRLLVDAFGWRAVMGSGAALTAALAAGIWIFVRDDPSEKGYLSHYSRAAHPEDAPHPSILGDLMRVLSYRNSWLLFLVPGGIVGSILTFAGLWGVPFLVAHYHFDTSGAAAITSAMMIAWAVGGPVFGAASDRIGRRKPLYVLGCAVLAAGWTAIVFGGLQPAALIAVMIATGFCSGCMIVGFAYAKESVPARLAGTATGLCNMGVMMGPMILQPAVGWMLDRRWSGTMEAGVPTYGLAAYHAGFALMLAWAAASLVLLLFTRETRCRQTP